MTKTTMSTSRVLTALKSRHPELARFPKGNASGLLFTPYAGVIRGIVAEGSKFKHLWRLRVFALLPIERVDFVVLSRIGVVDGPFWNSEKGCWDDGERLAGFGEEGSDYVDSVCGVFENAYMPWLQSRATPEDLLSSTQPPVPSDTYIIPRWPLRPVNEYLLLCIKCEEIHTGLALYDRVRKDIDAATPDENLLRDKRRHESTLEEYKAVLSASVADRTAWIQEREEFTLQALNLPPEFLASISG